MRPGIPGRQRDATLDDEPQGAKISSAPPNPTISPAACQLVTDFWCRTARARSTVHSGVVALMIPAVDESTVCSATANSRYGTALANSAATVMCAHMRAERGTVSRRASMTANSTAAPSASRAKVTSTGEKPRIASLIHRNADPQISASRACGAARCFTGSRLFDRHVVQQAGHVAAHHEPGQLVRLAVLVDAGVPDVEHRHARPQLQRRRFLGRGIRVLTSSRIRVITWCCSSRTPWMPNWCGTSSWSRPVPLAMDHGM